MNSEGPEISTFLGPKWHSLVHISGPKKVSISGSTPSNAPRYVLLPHPNPYAPPHINNRYINSYNTFGCESRKKALPGPQAVRRANATA